MKNEMAKYKALLCNASECSCAHSAVVIHSFRSYLSGEEVAVPTFRSLSQHIVGTTSV